MSNTQETVIYDGKLTAWPQIEIDKVLKDILPPVSAYKETKIGVTEIKRMHPKYREAREKLIQVSRMYSEKERSTPPVKAKGEVDHGFCD